MHGMTGPGATPRTPFLLLLGVKKALSCSGAAPSLRRGAAVGAEPQRAVTRQRSIERPIKSSLGAQYCKMRLDFICRSASVIRNVKSSVLVLITSLGRSWGISFSIITWCH